MSGTRGNGTQGNGTRGNGTRGNDPAAERPRRVRRAWGTVRTRPGVTLAASWLLLVVGLSLASPLWLPHPADHQDPVAVLSGPGTRHWLGTDELGRDVLSRILAAGAGTFGAACLGVMVAFGVGVPLALAAAEHGRRVEVWTSRVAEVLLALPGTVVLLAVIGVAGTRMPLVMAVLGLLVSSAVYRVLLGVAQSVRQRPYVDAARVNGLGAVRVALRHVLPGMAGALGVQIAQVFALCLLLQAGLAFMGFGPPAPAPSWGGMVAVASQHVYDAPWLMVPTGTVLALTVLSVNELADGLGRRYGAPSRAASGRVVTPQAAGEQPVPRPRAGDLPGAAALPGAGASPGPRQDPSVPGGSTGFLDVRHLTLATDGGTPLVTDLSLSLRPGRVLGLVGESGCGKTLTASCLLGLLPEGIAAAGGSVAWRGRDLAGATEAELRRIRGREIALVPQDAAIALDPLFPVGRQLVHPIRRMRGVGRRQARDTAGELLRQVGIADAARVLRRYPHELSGGMAQRVAIALALTGQPRLLVADEPTTGLDVTVQAEVLGLLRGLVRTNGMAVLLVSHDLGVVADLCDDVAVMYAGQLVETGTAEEVLGGPLHPYGVALLSAIPHVAPGRPVPAHLETIPGGVPAPGRWPRGCRFAARCAHATPPCTDPVPLTCHDGRSVRCARVGELPWSTRSRQDAATASREVRS